MAADQHQYKMTGGIPLRGTVRASGAKNAVTKQLVATLLTDQPCTISNVPRILEVDIVLDMLADLGADVSWTAEHTGCVRASRITGPSLHAIYSGVNRIPILLMGPLLHRRGEAVVPSPAAAPSASGPSTSTSTACGPWAPASPRKQAG